MLKNMDESAGGACTSASVVPLNKRVATSGSNEAKVKSSRPATGGAATKKISNLQISKI